MPELELNLNNNVYLQSPDPIRNSDVKTTITITLPAEGYEFEKILILLGPLDYGPVVSNLKTETCYKPGLFNF